MLVLHPPRRPGPPREPPRPLVALFGVGLLGCAVRDALVGRGYRPRPLALSWDDGPLQRRQLDTIAASLGATLEGSAPGALGLVWAAGRAGFASSQAETAGELESFQRVLALAESTARSHPEAPVSFHLLSSIGGLFEGRRAIDHDSTPTVLRPYGDLKLRQEERLLASDAPLERRIYRLTSVFGPTPRGGRRGLIATLIHNGLRHRVTRIVGRLSTLRDFIWTGDVASYLVADVLERCGQPRPPIATLAAGKPASIHELLRLVESTIGRRLYVQFDFGLANSMDTTVSPSLLPAHWRARSLGTAVRQLHRAALGAASSG